MLNLDGCFRKKNRLAGNTSKVIELGKKIKSGNVIVYYLPQNNPKLSVVISRKVGKSVLRNKLKRWAREIFRVEKINLKDYGIVIVYKKGSEKYSYCDIKKNFIDLWKRAGINVKGDGG